MIAKEERSSRFIGSADEFRLVGVRAGRIKCSDKTLKKEQGEIMFEQERQAAKERIIQLFEELDISKGPRPGKTTVVNNRDVYQQVHSGNPLYQRIDRQTMFGNKYRIGFNIEADKLRNLGFHPIPDNASKVLISRDWAVDLYEPYFYKRILEDEDFAYQVIKLAGSKLVCWCHPKRCHGDIIALFLNNIFCK